MSNENPYVSALVKSISTEIDINAFKQQGTNITAASLIKDIMLHSDEHQARTIYDGLHNSSNNNNMRQYINQLFTNEATIKRVFESDALQGTTPDSAKEYFMQRIRELKHSTTARVFNPTELDIEDAARNLDSDTFIAFHQQANQLENNNNNLASLLVPGAISTLACITFTCCLVGTQFTPGISHKIPTSIKNTVHLVQFLSSITCGTLSATSIMQQKSRNNNANDLQEKTITALATKQLNASSTAEFSLEQQFRALERE